MLVTIRGPINYNQNVKCHYSKHISIFISFIYFIYLFSFLGEGDTSFKQLFCWGTVEVPRLFLPYSKLFYKYSCCNEFTKKIKSFFKHTNVFKCLV